MYRILAREALGIEKITRQRIFCIVRDGGTHTARSYGIEGRTAMLEMPREDDDEVLRYFAYKSRNLKLAMANHEETGDLFKAAPEICTPHERWQGRKCEAYCPVADACAKIERSKKNERIES